MGGNIIYFGITFIGIAFIFLPVYILAKRRKIVENGEHTEAIVVRLEHRRSRSGGTYSPVFAYEVDGISYEHIHAIGTSIPKYEVGEAVGIIYYRGNPEKMTIESGKVYVITSIVSGLIGIVAVGFGVYSLFS